ncbi:UNVERIFIED_CONTAM: protein CHUP1, chloroplastic [Sesamum calycinum]|uniref:Protein CHUP1, chloroplastic n=1 Tax=Sesamum calycinum TaxID=2727403 RepID=A0AAW2NGE0_9LAMI
MIEELDFELLLFENGCEREKGKSHKPCASEIWCGFGFSLGGIVYTFFRSKRIKPSVPKPALSSPGKGSQVGSRREGREAADRALQDSSLPKIPSQNSISDLSSSGRCNGDRDGFLLPEFSQLVKECNMVTTDDISPGMNRQSLAPDVASPLENKYAEDEEQTREIRSLRNKVKILEERERYLEVQLLEYYGLKEQQNALMELQNRLRLNNMETKLYNLKIESLQADNRLLQAQVADYAKVVAELEAAKAKIKLLRKKLRSDAEQNREHILSLQERVMKLRDPETKTVEVDQDVEMQLKIRKELEEELEEMRSSNDSLKLENSQLAQKLEYLQMLATSALDNEEIRALKEESHLLRQQNEELRKEIEQIQADRCTDIEELVYLRWINACLRYEMRNYQPGPGSYLTDSGEHDDFPLDSLPANKMNHSSKTKVLSKLMKLWRGKDNHRHIQTPRSPPERAASVNDILSRFSSNPHSGISLGIDSEAEGPMKRTRASSEDFSRHSFNLQRSRSQGQKSTPGQSSNCSRRTSDDGSLSIFRTIDSINVDGSSPSIQPQQDAQNAANTELVKYAEALKNSRGKSSFRRRSASLSSF